MALSPAEYKLLEMVDTKTRYIVHGFIHELEAILEASINIPSSIIKICVLFFWIRECFEKCSEKLTIARDQKDTIIKNTTGLNNNVAYGTNWINSNGKQTFKWTFELIKGVINDEQAVCIGIVSNDDNLNSNRIFVYGEDGIESYFYLVKHRRIYHNGSSKFYNYGPGMLKQGSQLIMELNLEKGQLSFYVDNEYCGVAIDRIKQDDDTRYKLAVTLYNHGIQLRIIRFECL